VEQTFLSATILLVLVTDPVGNIPLFVGALKQVESPARRLQIIVRECAIAFVVLLAFIFVGKQFLALLQLTGTSLNIAGGVVLFLIAVRMIFPASEGVFGSAAGGEPFIVPLAIPAIAGPSALATVLLLVSKDPGRVPEWIGALSVAILICALVLVFAARIQRLLGEQVVTAFERLMGLILAAIAIEMLLRGIETFVRQFR
jgi:MarC family membrane protein